MAKKKIKRRLGVFKSKKIAVFAALVVAGLAIFAMYSYAATSVSGRVFSWKKQKVLYNFRIATSNPGGFVFVEYGKLPTSTKKNPKKYGVFTEKTNTVFGSRAISSGSSGDDVKVLQAALSHFGDSYSIDSSGVPKKNKELRGELSGIKIDGKVGSQTYGAVKAFAVLNSHISMFADCNYLKDGSLSAISQPCQKVILLATTSPVQLDSGIAFDGSKILFNGEIRVKPKPKKPIPADLKGYELTNIKGESFGEALISVWFKSGTKFGDRDLNKGDSGKDVKAVQQILKLMAKKGIGTKEFIKAAKNLATDGKYGNGTMIAVREFEKGYRTGDVNGNSITKKDFYYLALQLTRKEIY
jgi:peptidoglycan hydrolase-like protein with peptidoglycan-binding domain